MLSRPFLGYFALGFCLAAGILGPVIFSKHHQLATTLAHNAHVYSLYNLPICERNPFIQSFTLTEIDTYETWALSQRLATRRLIKELNNQPRENWEKLLPAIPKACDGHITRIGPYGVDGSKLLCGLDGLDNNLDCIIFSLGSHGDWEFETKMLNLKENCRSVTFDCTGDFEAPERIKDRAKFQKLCYGLNPAKAPTFQGIDAMMAMNQIQKLSFLKMDIEMGEWEYFEDMIANFDPKNSSHLPDQIVVEMHWTDGYNGVETDLNRLGALVDGWYDLGYRIIIREINLSGLCPTCYEVTLLRLRC